MPKCNTGNYIVSFYDSYGTKIRDKSLIVPTQTAAINIGEETTKEDSDLTSFTVDRRIYNSIDNREKY